MRGNPARYTKQLVERLNPVLPRWDNYFRSGNSDANYNRMDNYLRSRVIDR
jgi:hypothetical protein